MNFLTRCNSKMVNGGGGWFEGWRVGGRGEDGKQIKNKMIAGTYVSLRVSKLPTPSSPFLPKSRYCYPKQLEIWYLSWPILFLWGQGGCIIEGKWGKAHYSFKAFQSPNIFLPSVINLNYSSFKKIYFILKVVRMCVLCVWYVHMSAGTCRGQKRARSPGAGVTAYCVLCHSGF